MKFLFLLVLALSFFAYQANGDKLDLGDCKRLFWLTPTHEVEGDYMLLEVTDEELRKSLVDCFNDITPVTGIDPWMLDGKPADSGYLIFDLGGVFHCVNVYPFTNKPRAANHAKLLSFKPGLALIETISIADGFETKTDYRPLLKKIPRPKTLDGHVRIHIEATIAPRK